MIRALLKLLKWPLTRYGVSQPAHVEDRAQLRCAGRFVGCDAVFHADELGFHVLPETVEARARRSGAL